MSNLPPDSHLPTEPRHKLNRLLGIAKGGLKGLAWVAIILLTTILLALACSLLIQGLFGDVAGYQQWAETHRDALLIWRLIVYAALAAAWWPVRQRLRQLPGSAGPLARCECLAIIVIALYELRLHL